MRRFIPALVTLFLLTPLAVFAKGQWSDQPANVYVPVEQTISGNYYAAGEMVVIDGAIDGDLIVAGGTVKVNGTVTGDVLAAAGRLIITGPVLGDVRVAAGQVDIESVIGKNLTVFAGAVRLAKQSGIGYEAMIFAGEVDVEGQVKKDLRGSAGAWVVSGSIGQDMYVQGETVVLQPTAVIGGNLTYASREAAQVMSGATVKGEVNFQPYERAMAGGEGHRRSRAVAIGLLLSFGVLKLLGFWVLALAMIKLAPKKMEKAVHQFRDGMWPALGIGLLLMIGAPVAIVLLALTVIGLPLAGVLAAGYALALLAASVLVATFVGEWIFKSLTGRHWRTVSMAWTSLLGLLVIVVVEAIPVVGWLAGALAMAVGLGVIWQFERQELRRWR